MVEFADASKDEQISRLEELGRQALSEFGVKADSMERLVHAENTTFHVRGKQGEFCLRISRPGYQSHSNIESEIVFLDRLSAHGFRVPRPWQPRVVNAEAPGVPEARDCVLFHWVEGEIHRKGLDEAQMRQVGELTARLHDFAGTWHAPVGFDRQKVHTWLLDPDEVMAVNQPTFMIHEPDQQLLAAVAAESRLMAASLPRDSDWIRLIHSDLHHGNLVFRDGELHAIDFDDTGYGFLVYDFAATLVARVGQPEFGSLREALFEGYVQVRPLPPRTLELLPQFLRLRLASIANWLAGRTDNPEFREMAPTYIAGLCERIRAVG